MVIHNKTINKNPQFWIRINLPLTTGSVMGMGGHLFASQTSSNIAATSESSGWDHQMSHLKHERNIRGFVNRYGAFHSHGGTQKWIVYKGQYHLEMDDLEAPLFQETSIWRIHIDKNLQNCNVHRRNLMINLINCQISKNHQAMLANHQQSPSPAPIALSIQRKSGLL